ncbi:MAG TPA: class I SAM-dependent methyltransferase, partial [Chitinophagaceae bacterium]|nr:class I SAM-dependent methyltransferase [Chitinophagaceae bacterium]
MGNGVISPLTGKPGAKRVDTINREDILRLYQINFGMNVEKYFTGVTTIDVYECITTGYRFYHPASIIADGKFYEELQLMAEKRSGSYYREGQFDQQYASSSIGTDEKVLEIGCGTGLFLESLLSKTTRIVGIELNEHAIRICQEKGLNVVNELIEVHSLTKTEHYDTVCSFHVLEHVYEVKNFIDYSLKALRPGGKFILS